MSYAHNVCEIIDGYSMPTLYNNNILMALAEIVYVIKYCYINIVSTCHR